MGTRRRVHSSAGFAGATEGGRFRKGGVAPSEFLLDADGLQCLERCDALWASPGRPYRSMEGALAAIRFARDRNWPFVGT
jgi:CTP synthase (UTP-ammonia lyase)